MALVKYAFSISTAFPNAKVNSPRLEKEISDSEIVTAYSHTNTYDDTCDCYFKADLSTGDLALFNSLIAAHLGERLPSRKYLEDGTPIFALHTRSADGTAVIGRQQLHMGRAAFTRTDTGDTDLAINATSGGAPTTVWDGDSTAWTVSGSGTSSADAAHAGTYGFDSLVRAKDDVTLFSDSVDRDLTGYATLSFWVNAQVFPSGSRISLQWKTIADADIGQARGLTAYASDMVIGNWQHVVIPLADFHLTADVGKLCLTYQVRSGQHVYLDDLSLQTAGGAGVGPKAFQVVAQVGECLHVEKIVLVITAGLTGWDSTAFGTIAGGLTNGLLLRHARVNGDTKEWSINCKNNADLYGQYSEAEKFNSSSADMTAKFTIRPDLSSVLLVDPTDRLELVVRDDMSSLGRMSAFIWYGEEWPE